MRLAEGLLVLLHHLNYMPRRRLQQAIGKGREAETYATCLMTQKHEIADLRLRSHLWATLLLRFNAKGIDAMR